MKKIPLMVIALSAIIYCHSDYAIEMNINYYQRKADELEKKNNELIRKIKSETSATRDIQNKIKYMGNTQPPTVSKAEQENIAREYNERQEAKRNLKFQMSK